MSINRGMAREDVVHIYSGILVSHKKDKIMLFATTLMDLETDIQSEVTWTQKDKYHMILLICRIKKKGTS